MNPERNYKGTGEKILSEEVLNEKDLQAILKIGLDFMSEEIKTNNPTISIFVGRKSEDVQEYLPYITLLRVIDRYKDLEKNIKKAKENNETDKINRLSEAKSVQLFTKLKERYIETLKLSDKVKTDIKFDDKLIDIICCTPGFFNEEKYLNNISREDMLQIGKWAGEIVPGNPNFSDYQGVEHILD